jgi:DNA-binding MarR family transcriptional regulator
LDGQVDRSGVAHIIHEARELSVHPEFDTALIEYTSDLIQFRKSQRHLNKIIAQQHRFRIIGYLLHRHAVKWLSDQSGGVTYTELAQACASYDSSPRHLKTMLGLMQVVGFVKVERDPDDNRRKFYVPTDRLMRFVRKRVMCAAISLDILHPRLRCSQILMEDKTAVVRLWATGGFEFALGPAMNEALPVFFAFFRGRDGGAPLTFALMHAHFNGCECPSRSVIAAQFGLSKTQVTNLVHEGAELGLFTLDAKGAPSTTALMHDSYRQLVSIELAFFARHIRG